MSDELYHPPPPGGWEQFGYAVPMQPSMDALPPISVMLHREANAWAALLQLHDSVHTTAASVKSSGHSDQALHFDEPRERMEQRELAYVASLSSLAAACDNLHSEVFRLRSLRKAKFQLDSTAVTEIMRAHSVETLAMGETTAMSRAMSLVDFTTELKATTRALRTQISQAQALLQTFQDARKIPVPAGATLVFGIDHGDDTPPRLVSVERILQSLNAQHSAVDETAVLAVLAGAPLPATSRPQRSFARRAANHPPPRPRPSPRSESAPPSGTASPAEPTDEPR